MHHRDRVGSNRGDIKTQILLGLAHLHHHCPRAAQFPAAANRHVRPFHPFNGQHCAALDHHALADIPAADFPGHCDPQADVRPLLGIRGRCGERPFLRDQGGEEARRLNHHDPLALQLLRHTPENHVILEAWQPTNEGEPPLIWLKVRQGASLVNTASHDGLSNTGRLKRGDNLPQLTDPHPGYLGRQGANLRWGLPLMRHGNNIDPFGPGGFNKDEGKPAIASNQA